ncbi:MAG: hypothetical protein MJ222_01980 [Bacilli bacterium]|nr:hypothetical protein [Bacilli bacterium]
MENKWFKNYRFYVLLFITLGFVVLSYFCFSDSYLRLIFAFKDIGLSIGYYFCELFSIPHNIKPTINDLPILIIKEETGVPYTPSDISTIIPQSTDFFKVKWQTFWKSCWNKETFGRYCGSVINGFSHFARWILILVPIVIIFIFWFKLYFKPYVDSKDDKDSVPLLIFKKCFVNPFKKVRNFVKDVFQYYSSHRHFSIIWLIMWLINFNTFSILLGAISFYFYFVVSFDFKHIYFQIFKLFIDLKIIPIILAVILIIVLILKARKNIAYARLNHYEMRNRGFLNSLGLVVLISGVTGKGKTLMMTDLALSQEVMFRDKCLEKILENDLKFKNFNWNTFETDLKNAIYFHQIYTLATCEIWVRKKRYRFEKNPSKEKIFGYDYNNYGLYYNNGLVTEYLFDVLENYAKLYFVYIIESSLLVSNYGIRVDNTLQSVGHFPLWNSDFFRKSTELQEAYTRHSHIIDFDMLRLGKRVLKDNPIADSVEFGVFVITEVDKERGNQLTNQTIKADSESANPKNDLTELCQKIERHSATIDNYPFMRIFSDSQRPTSLGADSREIAEKIVYIREINDTKNTLIGFMFDEMIYDFFRGKFEKYYYRYRFARSDNTLFIYLLKNICGFFINRHLKKINEFGYASVLGQTEKSTMDGDYEDIKWYRINKKIYSNRYKSNCFKDYFFNKALKSPIGIDDLREYSNTQPTMEEYNLQNSYFIEKINHVMDIESEESTDNKDSN